MTPQTRRHALMLVLAIAAPAAFAQAHPPGTPATGRLGDHPAVVIQRLQRTAGYDHASKFYLHPAHLFLLPASPDELKQMQRAAQALAIDTLPDDPEPGLSARRGDLFAGGAPCDCEPQAPSSSCCRPDVLATAFTPDPPRRSGAPFGRFRLAKGAGR